MSFSLTPIHPVMARPTSLSVKLRTTKVTNTQAILHSLSIKVLELVVQLDCDFPGVLMLKDEQIFYLLCTNEFDQLAWVAN